MKRMALKFLNCGVVAMLAILSSGSAAALEWVQIGRVSGDTVCGRLETGIGDSSQLDFHRYSKFMSGGNIIERLRVQRGSTIAVRLLGHGADVGPSLIENIRGVTGSITAKGRYFHHPHSSGPIGFVEVRIAVHTDAQLGHNAVDVQWPTGRERIPLNIVQDCAPPTVAAPTIAIPKDIKCFGAGGSNCGAPLGPMNPQAACSGGLCLYSGGSWKHDECCAKHPSGHACGGPETFVSGETFCRAEMELALSRAASGFSWHRETNYSKVNTDGRVVAADACAPRGTIVHRGDEGFCCARQGTSRNPTSAERNKSNFNLMVKGYATPGVAHASIPPDAVACD